MSERATVLLVEDDADMAAMVSVFLKSIGRMIRVEHCSRLSEALDRLSRDGIDVVLLDLTLPDSRGLETFAHVHSATKHIPIIVMTGSGDEEQAVAAVRAGAEDYLFKGQLKRIQIVRTVRYSLERSRRRAAETTLAVHHRELKIARQIQQQLYPTAVPVVPGYELAGWTQPAEAVGGDYFDFMPLPDGTHAVAIGDASGHGVGPALLMAETRACLRTLAMRTTCVKTMIEQAAELLIEGMLESSFVTLLLTRLDATKATLDYVGAGHPPGMIFDRGGHPKTLLRSTTVPMGIPSVSAKPRRKSVKLHSGDIVVLTTDGIRDAGMSENRPFGVEGLQRIVRRHRFDDAGVIAHSLVQAVRAHCFPASPDDDLTVVVIRVRPDRPGRGRRLKGRARVLKESSWGRRVAADDPDPPL